MAPAWAKAVLDVQDVDRRIRDIKTRLSLVPVEKKRIVEAKKSLDAKLESCNNQIKQYELNGKKVESEIAALEETIRKNQQQSSLVKKNTEYQAMLSTVSMCQDQISELESKVLENFDLVEETKALLAKLTAENKVAIKSLKMEWKEFEELEVHIKQEHEKLVVERKRLRNLLPEKVGVEYDQLFAGNDGDPLVALDDEGMCGNCCLKITPQTQLRATSGAIVRCDNCSHLVYFEDAE